MSRGMCAMMSKLCTTGMRHDSVLLISWAGTAGTRTLAVFAARCLVRHNSDLVLAVLAARVVWLATNQIWGWEWARQQFGGGSHVGMSGVKHFG